MTTTDTIDGVLIEPDEEGFYLILSGASAEWRFMLPPSIALELMRASKREIESWWLEGQELARQHGGELAMIAMEEAYEITDPKHPRYHEVMSGIHDDAT